MIFEKYICQNKLTVPSGILLSINQKDLEQEQGKTEKEQITSIELLANSGLKITQKINSKINSNSNIFAPNLNIIQKEGSSLELIKIIKTTNTNNWNVQIWGDDTTTTIKTLILGSKNDQVEILETIISYAKNNQITHQTKAILEGESRAKIHHTAVAPFGTIDQNTTQKIQCLLLSPKAKIEMQPNLKISSSTTKANHGATIGSFDRNEIFYLNSRGLTQAQIKKLLVRSFASEILKK